MMLSVDLIVFSDGKIGESLVDIDN